MPRSRTLWFSCGTTWAGESLAVTAAGLCVVHPRPPLTALPPRVCVCFTSTGGRVGDTMRAFAGGPDGLTRWEVTIAQALSEAGYASAMWGKWHLGSDPENRSPVDFGFDEAVWSPRTADEVMWTMQSYFPQGSVTATPYFGDAEVMLESEPIYSRSKGSNPEIIATYDAEFRAGFDRMLTEWALDFMHRCHGAGRPFYTYLPYTQAHIPPIPDP